jgi:hypothetical protein
VSDKLDPVRHRMACTQMLDWFARQGVESRQGNQSPEVVTTQSAMARLYPPLSDAALAKALNEQENSLDGWIYGAETSGHTSSRATPKVVPAITASWSWNKASPEIQVMVVLVSAESDAQSGLKVSAFRFENGDEGTIHDFHHAQPAARFTHRGEYLPDIIPPVHESVPAFPLDAIGPVGIIMCALLSLYGSSWIERMFIYDPHLKMYVLPHLGELPAFSMMSARRASGVNSSVNAGESTVSGVATEAAQTPKTKRAKPAKLIKPVANGNKSRRRK